MGPVEVITSVQRRGRIRHYVMLLASFLGERPKCF